MTKTRIEVDRFEGTGDFLLWKVRMMAHFGVLGLKDILTDETLLMDPPKYQGGIRRGDEERRRRNDGFKD